MRKLNILCLCTISMLFFTGCVNEKWKWSTIQKTVNEKNGITMVIKRGTHSASANRVKVLVRHKTGTSKEIWYGYESDKPSLFWRSDQDLVIQINEGESHYYWPTVTWESSKTNVYVEFRGKS